MSLANCTLSVETAVYQGPLTIGQLDEILSLGFRKIELCCVPGRFNYNDPTHVRNMVEYFDSSELEVVSMHLPFGGDLDVSSLAPTVRRNALDTLKRCIDLADRLQTEVLVLHPGIVVPPGEDRSARIAAAVDTIGCLSDFLPQEGPMCLAVENLLPGFLGDTAEELCAIVEGVDTRKVGYCIDTGHAHLNGQMLALIEGCRERLLCIHIHDNHGDTDSHLLPMEGTIDWEETVAALDKANFSGLVTYEMTSEPDATGKLAAVRDNFLALAG